MKLLIKKIELLGILFLLAIGTVDAQNLTTKTLDLKSAKKVLVKAESFAIENKAPGGTIAIVDRNGQLILVERLDGSIDTLAADIAIRKAKTAAMFGKFKETMYAPENKEKTNAAGASAFLPLKGGVPISINGRVIGGIGVSGTASDKQDEEIALAGTVSGKNATEIGVSGTNSLNAAEIVVALKAKTVSYFGNSNLPASFIEDKELLNTTFGRNYTVKKHLRVWSRRAEIHGDDTDFIYVVQGTATFVTGGKPVYLEQVESNEFSSRGIKNGKPHLLKRGDVIIVPKNKPHLFKEFSEAFRYHVIKVR